MTEPEAMDDSSKFCPCVGHREPLTFKYTVNAGIAKGFGANLQHTMKILLLGEKKRETEPGKEDEEMTQQLQILAAPQFQRTQVQFPVFLW